MLFNSEVLPEIDQYGFLKSLPTESQVSEPEDMIYSSGLCDLQVNGFAGVDYNDPNSTSEEIEKSLQQMLETGVTACLPTVITGSLEWQKKCFQNLEDVRANSPIAKAMIRGYHLEGPYLNPTEGFRGCHPEKSMVKPTMDHFQVLQNAAGGMIRLITVAPEIEGVISLIAEWCEQGITVSLGHCNPSLEEIKKAVDAGARLSTHLGNGCAQKIPRLKNPILYQLSEDNLHASFIADGFHVNKNALKVFIRAKEDQRIILVSDATAGSCSKPGKYTLGKVILERQEEDIVYIPGTKNLAGSASTLAQGILNVMDWYNSPLEKAIRWTSEHPRAIIGLSKTPEVDDMAEWIKWKKINDHWEIKSVRLGNFEVNSKV